MQEINVPSIQFSNGVNYKIVVNSEGAYILELSGGPFTALLELAQLEKLSMPVVQEDLSLLIRITNIVMSLHTTVNAE
jgi:hypothetical protein